MSTDVDGDPRPAQRPPAALHDRLGYLLKLAQLRLGELTRAALGPYGIDGRELAVLTVLADHSPLSQQQAANRLGIDRTTMVTMIDGLEAKGLVERRPHPDDRRRNVVELTSTGRDTLTGATRANDDAERRFLVSLSRRDAERLKGALRVVVLSPSPTDCPPVGTRASGRPAQRSRHA